MKWPAKNPERDQCWHQLNAMLVVLLAAHAGWWVFAVLFICMYGCIWLLMVYRDYLREQLL